MIAHPETLDQLCSRVEALEKRVSELEHRGSANDPAPAQREPVAEALARIASDPAANTGPDAGVLTVAGRALLGIAGAYVLRAVAAAGVLPRPLLACAAALYAAAWIVGASRVVVRRRLAGMLYAATSILILAPMLWETCLRFGLPAWAAAAMLVAYVAGATVLAYRRNSAAVFSILYAGSALTALALLIATHQMAYFAVILLAMVAVLEFGPLPAGFVRVVVALAADCAVWIFIFIYRMPADTRADYPAMSANAVVGAAFLLFGMQAASVAATALRRAQPVTFFQTAQAVISFALALCAVAWLVPAGGTAVLGALCLVLAACCWGVAFGPMRNVEHVRNFRIFAVWGASLTLAGVFLVAGVSVAGMVLGCLGLIAIVAADRMQSKTLELQGVAWLAIAAVASGLLDYAFRALAGQMPAAPAWPVIAVAGCEVLAYAAGDERPGEGWQKQALHLAPALLAACAVAALIVRELFTLTALVVTPDVFHVALLRTVTLCCLAVALAFGGVRLGRPQMTRAAYAATGLVAAKLLFEDLRHGHMEFIAASIGLVALTLMLVPRLARGGRSV